MASSRQEDYSYKVLGDLILASFPGLVAFFLLPLTVYTANQLEFDYSLKVLWPVFGIATACCMATLLLLLVNSAWRSRISHLLFFTGVFLLLCELGTPVRWGLLDGESQIIESWQSSAIQALVLAGLVYLALRIPMDAVRKAAVPLVPLLCVIQVLTAAYKLDANTTWWGDDRSRISEGQGQMAATPAAFEGNVYHFVFDAYSSMLFIDTMRGLGLESQFRGFSFQSNNLANYFFTDESVPSYLTGTFYGGGSFRAWQIEAKQSGLAENLHKSGFRIWNYTPDRTRFWSHQRATLGTTGADILNDNFRGLKTSSIIQISLVRISPDFLRHEVSRKSDRLLGEALLVINDTLGQREGLSGFKDYTYYKRLSVPLLKQFLKDEEVRAPSGEYVYVHVILPHPPLTWGADCTYSETADFQSQTLCATRLMGEVIGELKRLNHYNQSLVVFQSDHGYHDLPTRASDSPMSPDVSRKLAEVTSYFTPNQFLARTRALLLVKAPFAEDRAMVVSEAPTQLVDIPATVYDVLGLNVSPMEGISIFHLEEGLQREIHMFTGTVTRDSDGRIQRLADSSPTTHLAHLSYTRGKGWKVYPDIAARFE